MEKKRFIFDLDGTLLTSDFHLEREMFYDLFGEKTIEFNKHVGEYLFEYERLFPFYDTEILSHYLKGRSGLPFTPKIIEEWIATTGRDPGVIEDGVMNLLEYLKSNDIDVDTSIELLGDIEMYNETMKDFSSTLEEKWSKIEQEKLTSDMEN